MSEPIWIQVRSPREGVELVKAMARQGIRAALVGDGNGCRVRIAATEGPLTSLLVEVALALKSRPPGTPSTPPLEAA
jgi:hypothetical protein